MNTHRDSVTHTEERELNDDRILEDIRRRTTAATLPRPFDARALAVRAVREYWEGRELGLIEPDGRQTDVVYAANVMALKKLRKDDSGRGEVLNMFIIALTVLSVMVTLWLFPSLLNVPAGLFGSGSLVMAVISLLLVGVLIAGLVDAKLKEQWLEEGKSLRHHLMGVVVGALFAAVVTLGIGLHTEKSRRRVAEEIAARRQAEEARRHAEERLETAVTSSLARERILNLSFEKMQGQYEQGSFEKVTRPVETLPVGNKKITVKSENVSQNNAVYRAEGEPLPKPVEIRMTNKSGRWIVEGKETGRFYAAVVTGTSGDILTLSVRNDDGTEGKLTWPLDTLVFQPSPGQRLFVVVDPKTNNPTDVREFEPDSNKHEASRPR